MGPALESGGTTTGGDAARGGETGGGVTGGGVTGGGVTGGSVTGGGVAGVGVTDGGAATDGGVVTGGAAGASSDAGAAGEPTGCSDLAGDCHSIDCDSGGSLLVDQGDVPRVDNPCLAGTCNKAGKPGSEPRDARTPCQIDGGQMCDGAGKCVECLLSADCGPGKTCSKEHACGAAACTDTDCGGVCPACEDGKHCLVDSDCASYACDSETQTCIADHCKDHHQSGNESDADCGGGNCVKCPQGQGCVTNFDCATNACDGVTNTCVSNQCIDHHVDGDETDVDCGGITCGQCLGGKKCKSNFDCLTGFCGGIPKTCQ